MWVFVTEEDSCNYLNLLDDLLLFLSFAVVAFMASLSCRYRHCGHCIQAVSLPVNTLLSCLTSCHRCSALIRLYSGTIAFVIAAHNAYSVLYFFASSSDILSYFSTDLLNILLIWFFGYRFKTPGSLYCLFTFTQSLVLVICGISVINGVLEGITRLKVVKTVQLTPA